MRDIVDWVNNAVDDAGYDLGVGLGHCVGLDIVERPIFNSTEDMVLKAGMTLTVHPQIITRDRTETVWHTDMFLVKENGPAEVMTKFPPELLRIKV